MTRWTTADRNFRTFLLVAQLDPDAIRARIRQARDEAGLTQQELADLIERHKRTVENYENVRVPDWAELSKIARVLNRPVEWFLHGDLQPGDDLIAEVNRKLDDLRRLLESLEREVGGKIDRRLSAIEEQLRDVARAVTVSR